MDASDEQRLLGFMERLTWAAEHGAVTRGTMEKKLREVEYRRDYYHQNRDLLREWVTLRDRRIAALRGVSTKQRKRLLEQADRIAAMQGDIANMRKRLKEQADGRDS